jgi:hypothetical protein
MPRRPRPALALGIVTLAALPASAATLTLTSNKDNTLYESTTGALSDGAGPHLYVGRTSNDGLRRRGLVAFDLSAIPATAVVTAATLTLNCSRSSPSGAATIEVHRVLKSWGEGTSNSGDPGGGGAPSTPGSATWIDTVRGQAASTWTTPGGDFSPTVSASRSVNNLGAYAYGSTAQMVADVQTWIADPSQNFGWLLRGDETNFGTAQRFDTRETTTASLRPTLTITYNVPEPTTTAFAATAACGFALRVRGRRRR